MAKPKLAALPPLVDDTEDWRHSRALALEVDHRQLERWIACSQITQELLYESGRQRAAAVLRHAAGFIREERDDLADEIRKLRAASR